MGPAHDDLAFEPRPQTAGQGEAGAMGAGGGGEGYDIRVGF
jgi:hypothetical protein